MMLLLKIILFFTGVLILIKTYKKQLKYIINKIKPRSNYIVDTIELNPDLQLPSEIIDREPINNNNKNTINNTHKNNHIIINLQSRSTEGFNGANLLQELAFVDIHIGKWNIFHKMHNNKILFSIASIEEPGHFELSSLPTKAIKGLSLFLSLDNLDNAEYAFDEALKTAKMLSFKLNGELLDDSLNSLTLKAIDLYKEKIRKITEITV